MPSDRFWIPPWLASGINIDVMNHAIGHHGFDILGDDTRSREIIQATVEFMRGQLVSGMPITVQ